MFMHFFIFQVSFHFLLVIIGERSTKHIDFVENIEHDSFKYKLLFISYIHLLIKTWFINISSSFSTSCFYSEIWLLFS